VQLALNAGAFVGGLSMIAVIHLRTSGNAE
jgi:hypothetical protein